VTERVTLKIPRPLYERLKRVIEGSGYRSVNEFVVHVLRDLVAELRRSSSGELTPREIELVKQRLRNLGYLD
jgi:metal-responsive CopG/Arc/MetJ family transcriptional regulator